MSASLETVPAPMPVVASTERVQQKMNRLFHSLFEVVAEEMGIDFENAGSTTLKREDLQRGFEPDTCFYVNRQ